MSSPPELNQEQLVAARASAWKQAGEPLLTLEAARDWVNERGLVLFRPLPQLSAPAPSLVEATLGASNPAPTAAESEAARGLLARLVGEGLALPLNLMGLNAQGQADSPDFVVSAQVFSFVFTMRGDKAWKLPPSTSAAVKVSPLGLRVYEVLTERGGMTAAELATELGREVTETAILRALSELWGQLRVIPLLAQGDAAATLWELTSRRFTKAIKAGANAGQPTALSALVSLYLAQVFAATEEEVVTFLSPLTARSRVREVCHALLGARQLDTIAVEGRTLLHIPGTLPESAQVAAVDVAEGEMIEDASVAATVTERPKKVGTGRIRKFEGERKTAGEFRGKPARAFAGGTGRSGAGAGRSGPGAGRPSARFGARADGKSDRERRPFKKAEAGAARPAAERTSFTKPWSESKPQSENRKPRPAGISAAGAADSFKKFRKPEAEDREPLGPREQAGLPPERRSGPQPRAEHGTFDRPGKPGGFAKRPYAPRTAGNGERPVAKRAYTRQPSEGGAGAGFKPRSYEHRADRERGADRGAKPGGFAAKRPYTPRAAEGGEGGSGERSFAKRLYAPREGGAYKPKPRSFERGADAKRPYTPRTAEGGERGGSKPKFDRGAKPGGFAAKRPYTPRAAEEGERTLPKRPYKPRAADADKRVFTKAPWVAKAEGGSSHGGEGGAGKRPYKPRGEGGPGGGAGARKGFGARPAGKFGGGAGAKFGGRPGAKFAGRPSGVRPGGKPAGKFGGKAGGFSGAKRAGPMGGARPSGRRKPETEEQR